MQLRADEKENNEMFLNKKCIKILFYIYTGYSVLFLIFVENYIIEILLFLVLFYLPAIIALLIQWLFSKITIKKELLKKFIKILFWSFVALHAVFLSLFALFCYAWSTIDLAGSG